MLKFVRCVLVKNLPAYRTKAIPGTVKRKCAHCKEEVWICPSSLEVVKDLKAVILCTGCSDKEAARRVTMLVQTPAQVSDALRINNIQENN